MAEPLQLVLQALATLESPASGVQQRREASLFLEQAKKGDAHTLLGVGGTLVTSQYATSVRVVGYTMLTDLVRGRWAELPDTDKQQLTQLAYQCAAAVWCEARPLKGKAAVLLSSVVRQQGADAYTQVVPQLVAQAKEGPAQAELACMVLHYLSEDLTFFDSTSGGENKRLFLAALTNSVGTVFPFLCEVLQQHFMLAINAQQVQQSEQLASHTAVIHAALSALGTLVEWTPMARIATSNVLDACTFFMTVSDFRLPALDVLKQVAGRKRTTEPWQEYAALMDALASGLISRTAEMGLLVPPGQLAPGLSAQLDFGGELEEVGKRLCALLVALTESHMRCLTSDERRLQLLQLLMVLTAHPYLMLPSSTLTVWAQLLRESTPGNTTSTGNNAALHGLPQAVLAQLMGPSHHPGSITPLNLPPECCQALLQIVLGLLPKVVSAADVAAAAASQLETAGSMDARLSPLRPPSNSGMAGMPSYFDTPQDWREFCLGMRGQIKVVLRAAAHLYPDQGMNVASQTLQQALSNASAASAGTSPASPATPGGAGSPAGNSQKLAQAVLLLDCAVHVQEATLPPLLDAVAQTAGLLDQLASLLQTVMTARFVTPRLVLLHARCLEAFGRVLQLRPDLAAPLVRTCLEVLMNVPLSAHGQSPPPPRITREWKATAEGRLSMANAISQVAKAAPAAIAPHLRTLSDQVSLMWDAGQLTEGERVLLWEGLISSASGVSSELAGQLLGWLLAPMRELWSSGTWQAHVASPQAFVQSFLPVEQCTDAVANNQAGQLCLGARAERWALYHQLTLLERAMRRTAPPTTTAAVQGGSTSTDGRPQSPKPPGTPGGDGTSAQGALPSTDYPMDAHLSWCLPAVAALQRCVHELAAAEAANQLGPLQGIMALDDIDKSLRVLGDESATGTSSREAKEPRCVAGGNVLSDGRYFIRSLREASSMIMSLAIQHASTCALWAREDLAAAITSVATLNLPVLDNNHVRLLIRHVASQLCARCPPPHQPTWILPMLSTYLPHLAHRLTTAWAALSGQSTTTGPGSASSSNGSTTAGQHHGRSKQDVDEVVGEVLLREVTREYMQLLQTLTLRAGERLHAISTSHTSTKGKQRDSQSGTPASASTDDMAGMRAAATHSTLMKSASTASMTDTTQTESEAAATARTTVFDLLMVHRPDLAELVVQTAINGMCWPDADSVAKAVAVCRFLVTWGLREGGPVQDAVLGPLLQAAIYSLAQVWNTLMQAELLSLLRALLVGALAHPTTAARVRATLTNLLQVPAQVLADFEAQLAAKGSEKEQRNIIKGLVAQAGGEEVRKVLAAVSKLPPSAALTVTGNTRAPAQRQDAVQADQDARLQGAIYNAIFG